MRTLHHFCVFVCVGLNAGKDVASFATLICRVLCECACAGVCACVYQRERVGGCVGTYVRVIIWRCVFALF